MRRRCVIPVVLLLCSCNESLYAPVPEEIPCGASDDHPCRFDCKLDCAATMVEMATACMQSLQGSFDNGRTRCDFPDGGQVSFPWPVPGPGSDLTARSWTLVLWRDTTACLDVSAEPLPWVAGTFHSTAEVQTGGRTYRQELTMTASSSDGSGAPTAQQIIIDCPDGRPHEATGPGICDGCEGGDCRNLPLLELATSWSGDSLDFELRAGDRVTPLFSCR